MTFGGFGGGNKSKGKSKGGGFNTGGALSAGRSFGSSFGNKQGGQSVGNQSVGGGGARGGSRSRGNTGGRASGRNAGGQADRKQSVVPQADLSSTRDVNSATEAVASVDTSLAGQFADAHDAGFAEGFTQQGTAEIAGAFAGVVPGAGLISSIATKGVQTGLKIGGETGLGLAAEQASGFDKGVDAAANIGITSSSLGNKAISAALGLAGPAGAVVNAGLKAHAISSNPNFQGGNPSADVRGAGGEGGRTSNTQVASADVSASPIAPLVEASTPAIGINPSKKAKTGLSFANAKKVKRKVKQRG